MNSAAYRFAAGTQSIGARSYQEDAYKLLQVEAAYGTCLVAVLADGMGGHAAGDVAAAIAIDRFSDGLLNTTEPPHSLFVSSLDEANRAIRAHVAANPERDGMGCTLIGATLSSDGLRWISVGDSLLLHVSASGIKRLNADHSMAPRLDAAARRGEISHEEALNSPSRNALLSAVSGDEISRVDISMVPLQIGVNDRIIVASDGLDTLSFDEILAISNAMAKQPLDSVAKSLVRAVEEKRKPKQDNVTVIVIGGGFAASADFNRSRSPQMAQATDEVATRPLRRG